MKIETLEQLKALPSRTPLLSKHRALHRADGLRRDIERSHAPETYLPAVTLIPSVVSQEQLAEMVAAFWSLETAPTPEAGMANALAAIGVSVDD